MKPSSPSQAKQTGSPRYFTGKACSRGHVAERMTSNRRCVECLLADSQQWKKDNRGKVSATSKAWRLANAQKVRDLKRAWNAAHPEGQKARSRRWFLANKDRANAQHYRWARENPDRAREAIKAWWEANRGSVNAIAAKRRAAILQRTPAWANLDAIKVVYQDAAEFRAAGLEVDVDHLIPLQGEFVSGLHVPENLRVCLSSFNRSKSNTFQI